MAFEVLLFGKISYMQNILSSLNSKCRNWSVYPPVANYRDIERFRIATTPYRWTGQMLIKTIVH